MALTNSRRTSTRITEGLKNEFSENKILVLPDVCRLEAVDVDDLTKIRDVLDDVIKEKEGGCEQGTA